MVTAYHTHEFEIPTASEAEVAAGTESGKVVTPATLGSSTAFATAAQGALADSAVQIGDAVAPALAANTMLVDNAAGDARETKTFAEVVDLLNLDRNIRHYGGSGSADNATAITAMAADVGFVRFPTGNSPINSDLTIDVPIFFADGAYITAASTKTVTITSRIESPRQWIFRGDGNYSLFGDGDSGEDSKKVHISWFGGFPTHNYVVDTSPAIARANSAMGNVREGVIQFDTGAYFLSSASTIEINRGVAIEGAGSRRTVFRVTTSDVVIFTTAEVAVKFKNIQFELSGHTARTEPYILGLHDDLEVENVHFQSGIGVDVQANRARITNVTANFGAALSAGSSLIRLARGYGHRVLGVQALTSGFGPDALLRIGGIGGVSGFVVDNVSSEVPSKTVKIDGSAGNIVRGKIDGVVYNGSSGTAPDYVVDFDNSGSFVMSDIMLYGVVGSAYVLNGIRFGNTGSGTLEDISLDQTTISGSSGIGIDIVRTAGTMRDILIGPTVNVGERATPISRSGTMSNIRVAASALSTTAVPAWDPITYGIPSLANNTATSISLGRSLFHCCVQISAGTTRLGIFSVRAAPTPAVSANWVADANTAALASVLSGTTGSAGNLTLGVQDGILYVENRTGAALNISITVMAA